MVTLEQLITFIWIIIKIVVIIVPLMVTVLVLTWLERKVISYMQSRIGPNRVGIRGSGQAVADAIKLLFKELIIPKQAEKFIFLLAPVISLAPALAAWSVIPFDKGWVLANVNAGVLLLFSITSLGVYGILMGGWSSNSKYPIYGALRSAAQMISYEIAMGFAIVGVILAAGSLNLQQIVEKQSGNLLHWYWLPLLPLFMVYWISGVAETNRAPFDVAEGESELVAGFHVEYSGIGFALFFLAEYANMILVSAIATLMFLGGWLSPFQGIPVLDHAFAWVPGIIWFLLKVAFFLYVYLWLRATFPRFRYDQIMRLGWKVMIPVTLVWVVVLAVAVELRIPPWF